jgi:hypothetical protein
LAAEAGELQHSHCPISRAARLVEAVRFPHSSRFQLGRARVPSVRFSPLDRVGSWLGRGGAAQTQDGKLSSTAEGLLTTRYGRSSAVDALPGRTAAFGIPLVHPNDLNGRRPDARG